MVCKVPWLRLLHIAYDKPLIGYCYTGRGDNSGAVFTVIDHITQTLHYSNPRPRFRPNWASSDACGVQNVYMQDYIYASTTWRMTSSVPTHYRRYMYSSVADLMAAGSWQLTLVSQLRQKATPTYPGRSIDTMQSEGQPGLIAPKGQVGDWLTRVSC